jgi:streptogramin lyase
MLLTAGGLLATVLAGAAVLERLDAPGPKPEGLASDGVHLWVADFDTDRIYRMDTGTGDVVQSYRAPGTRPEGLAWDGTHLWAGSWDTRLIYRLAVGDTALVVEREFPAPLGARPVGLAWDGEALWLTTWSPFYLHRIDPDDGEAIRSRDLLAEPKLYPAVLARPEDLAWDGSLWITDWYHTYIYRLDPITLEILETHPAAATQSVGLAFHQGYLWNGDTGTSTREPGLYRLDVQPRTPAERTSWGRLKAGEAP